MPRIPEHTITHRHSIIYTVIHNHWHKLQKIKIKKLFKNIKKQKCMKIYNYENMKIQKYTNMEIYKYVEKHKCEKCKRV